MDMNILCISKWLRKRRGGILHLMLKVWGQQQNRGGWNVDVLWLDECQSTVRHLHLHTRTTPNQTLPKGRTYACLLCEWTSVLLLCWQTAQQKNLDVIHCKTNMLHKYKHASYLANLDTMHSVGLVSSRSKSSQVPALPADIPAPTLPFAPTYTLPGYNAPNITLYQTIPYIHSVLLCDTHDCRLLVWCGLV